MAATDSFFALIGAHQHGTAVGLMSGENAFQKPLTAEKQSIKRQLYTTHEGAVGWEVHSSSTMMCAGKVDHKLPVNQSKGHTYTNPWPSHYLKHAHSHITRAGSHGQRFRLYWGSKAWHGHRSVTGETCISKIFTTADEVRQILR